MIELKKACQNILSRYPGKYIHAVNEFESVYAFILLNEGEKIEECTGILPFTVMDKQTEQITENLIGFEDVLQGEYKQYTRKELEGL